MNQEIDFSKINYGMPENIWQQMQRADQEHLKSHPICEICDKRPSVRITPVGTLKASCIECIDSIRSEIAEDIRRKREEELILWDD